MPNSGCDAFLITGQHDIYYLTGFFSGRSAMILLPAKGRPVYLVDSLNEDLARKMLKGIEIDLAACAESRQRTAPFKRELVKCVQDMRIKKLGIDEDNLPASIYKDLSKTGKNLKLRQVSDILGGMRAIKSEKEIKIIRKAARETVRIWKEIKKHLSPGVSERELATMLDVRIRGGGYGNAFPTIAAAGKNSAYPHAIPTGRKLHKGEHILVDFGIRLNGYCSDLTRIWAKGRINRKIRELEKFVNIAHDRTIKRLKSGANTGFLVKSVNKFFADNNLGNYIRHGLGHGVGLNIHEMPFLKETSREKLKKGMVITIEPGLYAPGLGGVRKEDMVLITEKGCEVLTQ